MGPFRQKQKLLFIFSIMVFTFLACPPAYAYLDPGYGSYLWQLLIAGLLGALFSLKMFGRKIASLFLSLIAKLSKGKNRH